MSRPDNLSQMPYADYLKTPQWKAKRVAAIQAAKGRCQLCNTHGPFHVHHRTYERRGHELLSDLLVLCESCHNNFHAHSKLAGQRKHKRLPMGHKKVFK